MTFADSFSLFKFEIFFTKCYGKFERAWFFQQEHVLVFSFDLNFINFQGINAEGIKLAPTGPSHWLNFLIFCIIRTHISFFFSFVFVTSQRNLKKRKMTFTNFFAQCHRSMERQCFFCQNLCTSCYLVILKTAHLVSLMTFSPLNRFSTNGNDL